MGMDLWIVNARIRGRDELCDIGIKGDRIMEIGTYRADEPCKVIDANGGLVTESFVNGHLHLDKVYTLKQAGEAALTAYNENGMGGAAEAITRAADFKASYDEAWILPNVRKALELAVRYGNTHILAFADVDTKARLEGVKALLKAKEEYKDRVTLEVVAFPQDGIEKEPGAEELVRQALELGADVVGGIPWIELSVEAEQAHVDKMCALAKEFHKPISMLLDDVGDAEERTLEMLCKRTLEMGFSGRVTAQHCRAMELYPENYFRKLVELLKAAKVGIVSDPHTGPLAARVRDLWEAGVPVALGQDDIQDAYYPFGRNNMLEVAFLASHLLRMLTDEDMERLYDMITVSAAKVLGLSDHKLAVGGKADLVVLEESDVQHAIWYHRAPKHVLKNGKEITVR